MIQSQGPASPPQEMPVVFPAPRGGSRSDSRSDSRSPLKPLAPQLISTISAPAISATESLVALTPDSVVQRRATQTPQIARSGSAVSTSDSPAAQAVSGQHEKTVTVPPDVQEAVAAVTGHKPSEVTVRRGPAVDRTAKDISADSYASDGVVHLPGSAPLTSDRSRQLLAHELTHVVQQRTGTAPATESSPAGVAAERQAMHAEATYSTRRSQTPTNLTAPSQTAQSSGLGAQNAMPIVSRSTSTASNNTASLPRMVVERKQTPTAFLATSPKNLEESSDISTSSGPTPATAQTQEAMPAAVQRRASYAKPPSPPRPTPPPPASPPPVPPSSAASPNNSGDGKAGSGAERSHGAKRGSQPNSGMDTAMDELWLERHAQALYPHLRDLLRSEFFRDRERRGRLMRED